MIVGRRRGGASQGRRDFNDKIGGKMFSAFRLG
jgi:hypothetical protein